MLHIKGVNVACFIVGEIAAYIAEGHWFLQYTIDYQILIINEQILEEENLYRILENSFNKIGFFLSLIKIIIS